MPQEFHAGIDENWLGGWLHSWDLKPVDTPTADGHGGIDTGPLASEVLELKFAWYVKT